jgi:hypothetical protein
VFICVHLWFQRFQRSSIRPERFDHAIRAYSRSFAVLISLSETKNARREGRAFVVRRMRGAQASSVISLRIFFMAFDSIWRMRSADTP